MSSPDRAPEREQRWTFGVEACRVCDAGRDWREIPTDPCGHDPDTHRERRSVEVIPADAPQVLSPEEANRVSLILQHHGSHLDLAARLASYAANCLREYAAEQSEENSDASE